MSKPPVRTRVRRRVTARGWGLLGAGIVAFVGGLVLGSGDLIRVGAAIAILVLIAIAWQLRPFPRFTVTRRLPAEGLSVARPAHIGIRLRDVRRRPRAIVLTERVDAFLGHGLIAPLADAELQHQAIFLDELVAPIARGPAIVGPTVLARPGMLGLTQARLLAVPAVSVLVRPRVLPLGPHLRLGPADGQAARQRSSRDQDDQIPREYHDGDDYRRIHWPATASHGALMVRSDEHSLGTAGTLHIAMASSPDAALGEELISAAASTGVALLDNGQRVTVSIDGKARYSSLWGPSDRGTFLDYLAALEFEEESADAGGLRAAGDLLAVIAPANDTTALGELAALGGSLRRIAVVVGEGADKAVAGLRDSGVTAIDWGAVVAGRQMVDAHG